MTKTPSISLVIPMYNRAHLIGATLESIIKQTYSNWECIVVDDGSNDASEEIVQNFAARDPRIILCQRPKHLIKGANSCRNYGFEKSRGAYIQWFDSDDLLKPNALQVKLDAFNPQDDYTVAGFATFVNTPTNITAQFNTEPSVDIITSFLQGSTVLNIPSFLYRKEAVVPFSFSETLTRAQDLDFVFRVLTEGGLKGSWASETVTLVRLHDQSITRDFKAIKEVDIVSELQVRGQILSYSQGLSATLANRAMLKYLTTLKKALKGRHFKLFSNELGRAMGIPKQLQNKLKRIGVLYRFTGKGLTQYSKELQKYTADV